MRALLLQACTRADERVLLPPELDSSATLITAVARGDASAPRELHYQVTEGPHALASLRLAIDPGDSYRIELAGFDEPKALLGLPEAEELRPSSDPEAARLPLELAETILAVKVEDGAPGPVAAGMEQAPVLSGLAGKSRIDPCEAAGLSILDVQALDLVDVHGALIAARNIQFLVGLGGGVALGATPAGRYVRTTRTSSVAREWPIDAALATNSVKFRSASALGPHVWLGGFRGTLARYDPATGTLETVVAEDPAYPEIEKLLMVGEREAYGLGFLGTDPHRQLVALSLDAVAKRWDVIELVPDTEDKVVLGIGLWEPGVPLYTGLRENVFTVRDGRVSVLAPWMGTVSALGRSDGGALVAGVSLGFALFGRLRGGPGSSSQAPVWEDLGRSEHNFTNAIEPIGAGFAFVGDLGWVGVVASNGSRHFSCGRRLAEGANGKRSLVVEDDSSFLVGGSAADHEPQELYRVTFSGTLAP